MHAKAEIISMINSPQRIQRIGDIEITTKHYYVEDIPVFCYEINESLMGQPIHFVQIHERVEKIMEKYSERPLGAHIVAILEAVIRSSVKNSLLLCEIFFEDEIDESRIFEDLTGKAVSLTQSKDMVRVVSYNIKPN